MLCQKLKTYMETGRVVFLNIRSIRPNRGQPRTEFQENSLAALADSIRQHGILQPLSVRRLEAGYAWFPISSVQFSSSVVSSSF